MTIREKINRLPTGNRDAALRAVTEVYCAGLRSLITTSVEIRQSNARSAVVDFLDMFDHTSDSSH